MSIKSPLIGTTSLIKSEPSSALDTFKVVPAIVVIWSLQSVAVSTSEVKTEPRTAWRDSVAWNVGGSDNESATAGSAAIAASVGLKIAAESDDYECQSENGDNIDDKRRMHNHEEDKWLT